MAEFNPQSTALVLIDLPSGIVGINLARRTGSEILATGRVLVDIFPRIARVRIETDIAF